MNQWRKGTASWRIDRYFYQSVVFSWDIPAAQRACMEAKDKGLYPVVGGPAVAANPEAFHGLAERPGTCLEVEPILFHNPLATFTTRGCPRACPWCIVPKIEPEFKELWPIRPAPLVCDNNFLAASRAHQERVVDALRVFDAVDFNQGLDARLFTPEAADLLGKLNVKIRFGFDLADMGTVVHDALTLARERTTSDLGVYCLIGLRDTPTLARERLELVRSWGIRPTPMRYQPINATEKNAYVAPGWTEKELRRMIKYYSRLRWFEHIPYDDFQEDGQGDLLALLDGKEPQS